MIYSIRCEGMEGLRNKYSNYMGEINLALIAGMEEALGYLKEEIAKRAPSSSGKLINSIKHSAPVLMGDMIHGEINVNPIGESGRMYGRMMETGSEPHSQRMPPPMPIAIWMAREGIDPTLLFPIRRKIAEIGYSGSGKNEGYWFVRETQESTEVQANIMAFFTKALKRVSS